VTVNKPRLESIAEQIRQVMASKDAAREKALPLCRETIRHCSDAIRAMHRHEFDNATALLGSARSLLDNAEQAVAVYSELHSAGFIRDAQKEYAEASLTLALVTRRPIPEPGELGIEAAAYLNGLGEAVGELRRYLLDGIRHNDFSQSEQLLSAMDDIYNILVGMDFPDAITNGLRRTTDIVRGILERTRSDLTLIMKQQELKQKLDSLGLNRKEAE
jgi:translin